MAMNSLAVILFIIQWIILAYLAFGTLYIFVFASASLFHYYPRKAGKEDLHRIAVMIPGYKEDAVILEATGDALQQHYPEENYEVIVIADSFQPKTLEKLKALSVQVVEVFFEHSTKSKALNKAMSQLPDDRYDIAVILDADNLMALDFLTRVNNSFNTGFKAIQGHRIAKNADTSFAVLDAVSEEINNSIFRRGHRVAGLSSSLIGSGMAFEYRFFKTLMLTVQAVGGFDKEIELKMLKEGVKIEYLDEALVYDEKVKREEVFVKQRRRWLSAQIHYASYFRDAFRTFLTKRNFDYLDKAIQMLLPPRILLIGLLPLFTLLSVLVNPVIYTILWAGLLALLILTFLFAIPRKFYNTQTLIAVLSIPKGIFLMLISLFTTKGANKKFIHTEHTTSTRT
ncbi:MAG: glycosyltransferase [Bacteroidetes bacterium]|nr:MAG: glycosyltransferase [Bacteroidota bacterium]